MSHDFQAACAIILAAGVGRRLGAAHAGPKCLLQFDGRTLLERHVEALHAAGVQDIAVTVGFEAEAVRTEVKRIGEGRRITLVENSRFQEGSLVSLWVQGERLRGGRPVILMDADVLCDARMLARLEDGAGENRLLFDPEIEPGDEPVKICLRDGSIVDFRKVPEDPGERFGESVGFFRFSPEMAGALADRCDAYVGANRLKVEYEEAIRDLILAEPRRFAIVNVGDLPWTEIDFEEDVVRARRDIFPSLAPISQVVPAQA